MTTYQALPIREDLILKTQAIHMGYKITNVEESEHGDPIVFGHKSLPVYVWHTISGWATATLIDNKYKDHAYYEYLVEALNDGLGRVRSHFATLIDQQEDELAGIIDEDGVLAGENLLLDFSNKDLEGIVGINITGDNDISIPFYGVEAGADNEWPALCIIYMVNGELKAYVPITGNILDGAIPYNVEDHDVEFLWEQRYNRDRLLVDIANKLINDV